VLILTPTRELAVQVRVSHSLGPYCPHAYAVRVRVLECVVWERGGARWRGSCGGGGAFGTPPRQACFPCCPGPPPRPLPPDWRRPAPAAGPPDAIVPSILSCVCHSDPAP
jgi:hypothetical protein